jgi:quercetin dioxygenase-like cupin family protein
MTHYSSKDFTSVPDELTPIIPDRLIHKSVVQSADKDDAELAKSRQHPIAVVDLPSFAISVTLAKIDKYGNTRKHRHNYETIIYIIKGKGKTIVNDKEIFWEEGDAIYVPIWSWHQHFNLSDDVECEYIGCENAPMLRNMGNIAIRQEK